jgi:hypothetical protein
MNASIAYWNRLVHLVKPRASDIRNATGLKERPYRTNPSQYSGALTDNLFVAYYFQEAASPNPLILSTWIVFKDIFGGGVSVKPETLPPASLFGMPIPCSAQAFLEHLKRVSPNVPLQLSTERDRFAICIGAGKLDFFARSGVATTPEESDLVAVTFFFSIGTANPARYEFSALDQPSAST